MHYKQGSLGERDIGCEKGEGWIVTKLKSWKNRYLDLEKKGKDKVKELTIALAEEKSTWESIEVESSKYQRLYPFST